MTTFFIGPAGTYLMLGSALLALASLWSGIGLMWWNVIRRRNPVSQGKIKRCFRVAIGALLFSVGMFFVRQSVG